MNVTQIINYQYLSDLVREWTLEFGVCRRQIIMSKIDHRTERINFLYILTSGIMGVHLSDIYVWRIPYDIIEELRGGNIIRKQFLDLFSNRNKNVIHASKGYAVWRRRSH